MLTDSRVQRLITPVLKRPFVFLETTMPDRLNRQCLLFKDFEAILTFSAGENPKEFFASIERYLSKGYWACGYFEYEFGYVLEPALAALCAKGNRPLAWIGICRKPLELRMPAPGRPDSADLHKYHLRDGCVGIRAAVDYANYRKSIAHIHRWLKEGQTYQINYTFGLKFRCPGGPLPLYLRLRHSQPTSYTAWVHTGTSHILSFSPELFFRKDGRQITVCPMKGTVRRGLSASEDAAQRAGLARDEKIRSENLMIVDLLRNDLGRISQHVRAGTLFEIQKFRTLYQMISTIRARLKKGIGLEAVFRALFPSGSVTGAPKIRSMQLIRRLEAAPRGVYTGAIGYLHGAKACLNVPIRTLTIRGKSGSMGVGGGIVEASEAASEYREALLKSEFLKSDLRDFYVFETMAWQKGRGTAHAGLHLKRLAATCDYFQIPFSTRAAVARLRELAVRLRRDRARLR
ncbi:MAG: chorismate-binding protein, partial [Candidatus Omnitrophota bacterium]